MEFLYDYRDWFRAFHIISVMFWMAGMYYLPRLFVYHAEAMEAAQPHAIFETMEVKLFRIIMNPAMISAWIFGLLLLVAPGYIGSAGVWLPVKLLAVVVLTGYHGFLARERRLFLTERLPHTSRFYRMINEIPPILTILIVLMVVVQPF